MISNTYLVDAIGVLHQPANELARIVSLVPSITELLFSLELGTQVVGRTTFCIHPSEELARVPRVGGTKKVRLDRLRALSPTHVIVNIDENQKSDVEAIATFVPNVIVTHPIAPTDNLNLYRLLGGIFNRDKAATTLCDKFERTLDDLRARASALPRKDVLYLIWHEPWMTVSPPTYIARLLELVNWITPEHGSSTRYPSLCKSSFQPRTADVVLFSSEPFPFKQKHVDAFHDEFGVERERLLFIDGEMTSWYGSRAIEGLRYIARFATGR